MIIDDTPKMAWRNCRCPVNDNQDGVCGCPQFWERKAKQTQDQPDADPNAAQLRSPSTTPSGPPREICFFWYHGTCRRADQCKLAHEFHVTWPMTPPPGFVHYTPCTLPFCPLRQDLVIFKQAEERKKATVPQLGGQLDGSAFSSLSRSTRDFEATSSWEDAIGGQDTTASFIDPSSRALIGPYPDSNCSESGSDDCAEGALVVNVGPPQHNPDSLKVDPETFPTPAHNNMDYLDLSEFATPPPSSDTEETPILSLSHSGTLGKRERSTSPEQQSKGKNKRERQEMSPGEQSRNKRARREPSPDLNSSVSIFRHGRHVKKREGTPSSAPNTAPTDFSHPPDFSHILPTRPKTMPEPTHHPDPRFPQTDPRSIAPTGPRALNQKLVCFFWYHKGQCTSKRKNGGFKPCKYAHNLEMPNPQVSFPPGITDHKVPCPLPLCPVKQADYKHHDPSVRAKGMTGPFVEKAVLAPPKRGATESLHSPPPRNKTSEADRFFKGPKSNRSSKTQPPKLTGANRAQVKMKKRNIEQWKADNSSRPVNRHGQKKAADKIDAKIPKKQQWRENCARMMTKIVGSRGAERVLDYGDGTLFTQNSATVAAPAGDESKEGKVTRDTREIFEADADNGGRKGNVDTGAELYKDSFQPFADSHEHALRRDSLADTEIPQQHPGYAMNMVQSLQARGAPGTLHPFGIAPSVCDEVEYPENSAGGAKGFGTRTQGNRKRRVLVDYELPMGDARLDWDTDRVRRLFGEIE